MASDRGLMTFFLRYAKQHKAQFLWSFLMMPIYAGLLASAPAVMKWAIDDGILNGDVGLTIKAGFLYLLCITAAFIAQVAQHWWMQGAGVRTLADIREAVVRHLSFLGKDNYDSRPLGVYVSRATSDVEAIGETFAAGLTNIISDGLLIVFIFANMILVNTTAGLYSLVLLPVIIVIVDVFRRILRRLYDRIRTINAGLTARINESLTMLFEVKNFHLAETFSDDFKVRNLEYRDKNMQAISHEALVFSIIEGLSFVAIGVVLLFVSQVAEAGQVFAIGSTVAYIQWLGLLFPPLKQMGSRFAVLQSAFAAISKIYHVMNLPLPTDAGTQSPEGPEIQLRKLNFSYLPGEPVLTDVNVRVPAKSSMAVVGPTGSGKSTLIRLLVRQYDIEDGQGDIVIGDVPINDIPREVLKKTVVLIPQEPAIFNETIFYNIALNRSEVTRERVHTVCKAITADRFIAELPDGYDTVLAGEGANLSMGQRQLIAMARALVSEADILIFDEATANIDTETERLIQHALDYVMRHKTTILIAHRLSTIRGVDMICVLHRGTIVDRGTHQELMQRPGLYRRMYELQSQRHESNS